MPAYNDCSHETQVQILHKLDHEYRIPQGMPGIIMQLLGFNTDTLWVWNEDERPSLIRLSEGPKEVDWFTVHHTLGRLYDAKDRVLFDAVFRMVQAQWAKSTEEERRALPPTYWAAHWVFMEWLSHHVPAEAVAKTPLLPWPAWLPRKLKREMERPGANEPRLPWRAMGAMVALMFRSDFQADEKGREVLAVLGLTDEPAGA